MNANIVMINASPRIEKNSNTDKIIEAFGQGLLQGGCSFTKYAISNRDAWEEIRQAYMDSTNIIFAVPLYVECVPGLFLEFLEQLPLPVRFMVNLMFKTYLKRKFQGVARKWGCDIPLDRKVFDD